MGDRLNNILSAVGNTPIIKINKLAPEGINLYVKAEGFNPMGSVKDRMANAVIEDADGAFVATCFDGLQHRQLMFATAHRQNLVAAGGHGGRVFHAVDIEAQKIGLHCL